MANQAKWACCISQACAGRNKLQPALQKQMLLVAWHTAQGRAQAICFGRAGSQQLHRVSTECLWGRCDAWRVHQPEVVVQLWKLWHTSMKSIRSLDKGTSSPGYTQNGSMLTQRVAERQLTQLDGHMSCAWGTTYMIYP